jgi:hypothetical protein
VKHSFKLPPEYQTVKQHLQSRGTWHKTTAKFNVLQICSAINRYLAFYGDMGDLCVAMEELRDFSSVDSWLEAQGAKEAYTPEPITQSSIDEFELRAKLYGFKLLTRSQVAVDRNEYVFLKGLESNFKKQCTLKGWPF